MPQPSLEIDVAELTHAVGLLIRRLRTVGAANDLSWTESAVIGRLARHGPATTADLARAEGITPQSMRAVVTTLEEAGIVSRSPHPTDGRQMNVELTPHGTALRESARDAKHTWLASAIAELDEDDRATLSRAGAIFRRLGER